jgi:hypothetical protein
MDDALTDHDEFADALYTLFDSDEANGGTKPVSNREQIIDRLVWVLGNFNPERDSGVDLIMVARAMLSTYEATLARIASRERPRS